jgi:RNA polymerase sigma-70 factor (ECF subfamily)
MGLIVSPSPSSGSARVTVSTGGSSTATQPVSAHIVHAIAILRGVGRVHRRPLSDIEAEALAVIYRSYGGMLMAVLHQLLGDRSAAEDVLHDVFCRLPSIISLYRDHSFGGWLRQITVRSALTHLRSARRRQECLLPEPELLVPSAVVESDFEAIERREELTRALAQLPEPLRQVVVLRVIMDFTHQQVAEALGISATASEVRMCRALKQLRALLRKDPREGTDDVH